MFMIVDYQNGEILSLRFARRESAIDHIRDTYYRGDPEITDDIMADEGFLILPVNDRCHRIGARRSDYLRVVDWIANR